MNVRTGLGVLAVTGIVLAGRTRRPAGTQTGPTAAVAAGRGRSARTPGADRATQGQGLSPIRSSPYAAPRIRTISTR